MRRIISYFAVVSLLLLYGLLPVEALQTGAKSAVVINADTGEILWSQNCDTRLPMASTTKIMTALLLCENGDLGKEITVTPEMVAVEGSSMGLLAGDKVTLHDLLYGMMLASGNDAANTTAMVLGGTVQNFVSMMNERAAAMGLKNTHFVTPSGLDADEHYTTAYELALIAKTALNNDDFATAADSESATLCYGNPPYRRTLSNHNRLLKSYDDVIGVKTGFTKKSGRCLVSAAQSENRRVIAVTLNDPNDWADHRNMLDYGLSCLESVTAKPHTNFHTCVLGGDKTELVYESEEKSFCVKSGDTVYCKEVVLPFAIAPVKSGEVLGKAYFYCGEKLLYEGNITAKNTVSDACVTKGRLFLSVLKNIIRSIK